MKELENIVTQGKVAAAGRALAANKLVQQIRSNVAQIGLHFLTIGRLLGQIHGGQYYRDLGFTTFSTWFESAELGFTLSKAMYLIRIAKTANELNLEKQDLEACGIDKLKEIVSLSPHDQGKEIKKLVKQAPKLHKDDVRAKVRQIIGRPAESTAVMFTVQMPNHKSA